jgi:hypothetical protein
VAVGPVRTRSDARERFGATQQIFGRGLCLPEPFDRSLDRFAQRADIIDDAGGGA